MTWDEFTVMLKRINFPEHIPTFRAAIKGHPLSRGRWLTPPMEKEEARKVAREAMFFMVLRAWEKVKENKKKVKDA